MIHPHTELRFVSEQIGYGVFATEYIPRGTITWIGDALDQKFPPRAAVVLPELLETQLEKYSFRDCLGQRILCWDHARFINHACNANCLSADFDFEIAVRDIPPGEQLTDDYGTLNLTESFRCLCAAPNCRRMIHPDDLLRFGTLWDGIVGECLPCIQTVMQPLWPLLRHTEKLQQVLAGRQQLPPLASHYCGLTTHV